VIVSSQDEFILKKFHFCFSVMNIHINIIIMRRLGFFHFLICLLLPSTILVNTARAQMPQRGGNQVAIMGWTDDTHYQIRNFDSDKNLVIQSVDIKTGKGVVIPPANPNGKLLVQALPEGTTLSMNDVISPD